MSMLVPLICGVSGDTLGYAKVDASDSEFVGVTWRLSGRGYAVRWKNGTTVMMHREILGLRAGDGQEVDHINRDKLDNRRANLRIVTHRENGQNLPSQRGTSRFRGVSWYGERKKWTAQVQLNGRHHSLGYFATEEAAGAAAADFRREHMPFSQEATDLRGGNVIDIPDLGPSA